MKKRLPVLLVAGTFMLVVALVAWVALWASYGRKAPPVPGARVVNVGVMEIRPRAEFVDYAELPAVLEALRSVTVSAEVAGRVEEISGVEGRDCSAGDSLLKLNTDLLEADADRAAAAARLAESSYQRSIKLDQKDVTVRELEARVAGLEANTKQAKAAYTRTKQLHDEGVARDDALERALAARDSSKAALDAAEISLKRAVIMRNQDLEAARAARDQAVAVLAAARARLKRAGIASPVSGVLDDLMVERGEYVAPGVPVARVVDSSQVKAVVMVPERDVRLITVGTPAEVRVRFDEGRRSFPGKVAYVSQLADRRTRTTRVEVLVDNPEKRLRSGLIATVRLPRRTLSNVIMIPLKSVVPLEKGNAVYVVEESRSLRMDAVCAGISEADANSRVAARLKKELGGVPGVGEVKTSTQTVRLKPVGRLLPETPMPEDVTARLSKALETYPRAKVKTTAAVKSVVLCTFEVEFDAGAEMGAARAAVTAKLESVRKDLGASTLLGAVERGSVAVRKNVTIDTALVESRAGEQYVRVAAGLAAGERLIVAGHGFVAPGQPVRVQRPAAEKPAKD